MDVYFLLLAKTINLPERLLIKITTPMTMAMSNTPPTALPAMIGREEGGPSST